MNLTPYQRIYLRQKLRASVRSFFDPSDYLEVDTPIVVGCPGTETYLRYFQTSWCDFRNYPHQLYLRSSPEIHMKQLLSKELPKIYQMAPCFRNHGEFSDWHHPEFLLLEWYEAGISFEQFMTQTEDFLRFTASAMKSHLEYCGIDSSFCDQKLSLKRLSVFEAFEEFAGLTLIDEDPDLAPKAQKKGVISIRSDDDFETAFFKILLEKIEPELERLGTTILFDYPPSQAALAMVRNGAAKRCEVYIGRVELSNGFEELFDPKENERRFLDATSRRKKLGFETPALDSHFIEALTNQFLPSCGQALGLDRWLAIICKLNSIDEIVPFRTHY
jgi:lysyl-tRNA synthetase class 2